MDSGLTAGKYFPIFELGPRQITSVPLCTANQRAPIEPFSNPPGNQPNRPFYGCVLSSLAFE